MTKEYYATHYGLRAGEAVGNRRESGRKQIALMSMSNVARVMGISKSAVQQLERRALGKLRAALGPWMRRGVE